MDLFSAAADAARAKNEPLAARMRPRNLAEYIGQEHILGEGRLLRRAIQIDQVASLIFYGPPGTGKTTLARVIANTTKCRFLSINAVLAGVKDIREAIEEATRILGTQGQKTLLFVDEVHRFNKAQQDALLPHVESGLLTLIGATTENPYFEVNKALVSRSRIFELRSLTDGHLARIARQALDDPERGYGKRVVRLDPDALDHLVHTAAGDARSLLNALELAVETTAPGPDGAIHLTLPVCEESIQQKAVLYDKDGDAHYDVISAFIKSVRGSDPDGALYWMARMVHAGEDPRFIFRRMIILAAEDIGLADPRALSVVMAAAQAYDYVGLPEGRFHLSEACLYLCQAPKSNSTMAFFDALKVIETEKTGEVPDPLKDGNRDGADFGHGKGYLYPHAFQDHWVAQAYLPKAFQGRVFYQGGTLGWEGERNPDLERHRDLQVSALMAQESRADTLATFQDRFHQNSDQVLGLLRDLVLPQGELVRDQLILVVEDGGGTLFWEALRRKGPAGVHTLATPENRSVLQSRIPRSVDPSLYQFLDPSLPIPQGVLYDRVLFLNALPDLKAVYLTEHLASGAVLSFAQVLPREGGRISGLIDWKDGALSEGLSRVEDRLYAMAPNPRHRLTSAEAGSFLQALGAAAPAPREIPGERHLTARELLKWFPENGPSPWKDALSAEFGPQVAKDIQTRFVRELSGKTVPWVTRVVTQSWRWKG